MKNSVPDMPTPAGFATEFQRRAVLPDLWRWVACLSAASIRQCKLRSRLCGALLVLGCVFAAELHAQAQPISDTVRVPGAAPEEPLTECSTTSPWCKSFLFGLQFLPDYDDEDGSYSGLDDQAFFAHFNFESLRETKRFDGFGFGVRLHQSGAVTDVPEGQAPSIPSRFNQVADTVDLSGYYKWIISSPPALLADASGTTRPVGGARFGVKFVGGGRTRERAIENEDTLSAYAALGFTYAYHDALPVLTPATENSGTRYYTSTPKGEFDIGVAYYEDWAGREQKLSEPEDYRIIFRGVYQLRGQWFLGVLANGGRGPDEVSIFFGARKSVGDLLEFIGLNS